jgi:molybdopterin-dependent oxidoreductase alpha subunit
MANKVGWLNLWRAMSSRNACKTCALGMGGQAGGMINEAGRWPEVCKKSFQAMVADMQGAIQPKFWKTYGFPELRSFSPRELETCGRLVDPVYAGPGESSYHPITWEEAFKKVAEKLRGTPPDDTFFYFSGRSSNEAGFLLQLFARVYGTNNVNNCSYYCHQASGVGLTGSLGTGTATLALEDIDKADLFFLIGGNPASNHPRLMRSLMDIRRRGGEVIVINPVVETGLVNFSVPSDVRSLLFGSEIASMYVKPHIGGDSALLLGVAKVVLERGGADEKFIQAATEGFDSFRDHVSRLAWPEIEAGSGVDRGTIERIAERYLKSKNAVFGWTMGITHHEFGVENVQNIVNLALLRGMAGREGAGVLPIRGHSNVQGIGSMGVTPKLKDAIFDRLQKHFGVTLPTTPGLDTLGCMEQSHAGRFKVAFNLGGNLYGSNPDADYAREAFRKLDMTVYLSTTLNTGHAHGRAKETLILPVLARDEEPEPTTQESMFNYVRLSDGGKPRHQGPLSEVAVIAELANRVLGSTGAIDWEAMRKTNSIRAAIAKIVPGYEQVESIGDSKKEFHIPGRLIHEPRFPTPSGRARFLSHPIPKLKGAPDEFRLMTVRSEGQFNTVVYEEEDLYRGQERRDVILMNQADLDRLELKKDDRVTVFNDTGRLSGILVRPYDIREGNVLMYYPETNVLVPRSVDPSSRTPAFKSVLVRIEAEGPLPATHPLPVTAIQPLWAPGVTPATAREGKG